MFGNSRLYFNPGADASVGGISLFQKSIDDTPISRDLTDDEQVRYVLIPGGKPLKAKAKTGDLPIDLDDYQQVKRYFGIRNE